MEIAMHRPAVLLLCVALAVATVVATPAPFPSRGRLSGPWLDGWHKPVDLQEDCRFDRRGDKLTITVPGKGHEFAVAKGRLNAPRLQRDVEGDFVMEVRVGAASPTTKPG
jgi:hypothetical protein